MRLHHFTTIFAIVAIMVFAITDTKITEDTAVAEERRKIDRALDRAVDVGTKELLGRNDISVLPNREIAVSSFYNSLYASFGIIDAPLSRRNIELYIPIVMITDKDGFYICYLEAENDSEGHILLERRWSDKVFYSYDDGTFIYRFTTDTDVAIYDKAGIIFEVTGDNEHDYNRILTVDAANIDADPVYELLLKHCPKSIILNKELFEQKRNEVILSRLEEYLEYYCSYHNRAAAEAGVSYSFTMPVIDNSELLRAVSDISMFVLFQGYPLYGSSRVYNRFSVANAQICEKEVFYLEKEASVYHRYGCRYNAASACDIYYSQMECAKRGAYACPYCCPDTGAKRH